MRPRPTIQTGDQDLLKSRLDQFIDMQHRLVVLADEIDWEHIDVEVAGLFPSKVGRAATASRFMIGLLMLKA